MWLKHCYNGSELISIPFLLFCSTGITFPRSDASLSGFSVPQGLFQPTEFIPILLFFTTGIISTGQIHPQLALFHHRDYFGRPDASLSSSFVPQGLFRPTGCISIGLFFTTGITLPQSDASLSCFSVPQGLFQPTGFISSLLFCSTGIISTGQMHPYLPLLLHRDYFAPVRYVPPSLKTSLPGHSVNFRFCTVDSSF